MNKLTWNEFVNNVQHWAAERGIYDHSTPIAQLLKALSELGEVADAVIKNDRDALADGIGDVCVCIVNYATMSEQQDWLQCTTRDYIDQLPTSRLIGMVCNLIGSALEGSNSKVFSMAVICALQGICAQEKIDFMECCTQAWEEIKNRRGTMSAGGVFVKEDE